MTELDEVIVGVDIERIYFEKDEYTLPEVVKKIDEHFEMHLFINGKLQKVADIERAYQAISQQLRRYIEASDLIEKTKVKWDRNRKYKSSFINALINSDEVYFYLQKKAENINKKAFNEWKKDRKKHTDEYGENMVALTRELLELRQKETQNGLDPQVALEKNINSMLQRYKVDIALEALFSEFIELDEDKLLRDITSYYFFDEKDPDIFQIAAWTRLRKLKNYYKINKELTSLIAPLKKSQSHEESNESTKKSGISTDDILW